MDHISHPHVRSWIIIGITNEGKAFRPSNWADRLGELDITFDQRGLFSYSDRLHPINFNGATALRVCSSIATDSPKLWEQLKFFIRLHDLQFIEYLTHAPVPEVEESVGEEYPADEIAMKA